MNLSSVGARFGCLEIVQGKGTEIHKRLLGPEARPLDRSGWEVLVKLGSGKAKPDFTAALTQGATPMGELSFRRPAHRNGFQMPLKPDDARNFVAAVQGFMDSQDGHTFSIQG